MISRRNAMKIGAAGILGKMADSVFYGNQSVSAIEQPVASRGPALTRPIVVMWRFDELGIVHHAPLIAHGKVYAVKQDTLHVLDAVSGNQDWLFRGHDSASPPVIADDVLLLTSGYRADGRLYALEIHSGQELWSFTSPTTNVTGLTINDSTAYFGSEGTTHARHALTGEETWRLSHNMRWSGTLVHDENVLFALAYESYENGPAILSAIDPETGLERWTVEFASLSISPVISDGTIYGGGTDGVLHAYNTQTGEPRWQFRADSAVHPPRVANGSLYTASQSGTLYALDQTSGSEKWRYVAPDSVRNLTIDNNRLYFLSGPTCYALDADSGTLVWQFSSGLERFLSDFAVAQGMVYVAGENVYAIDAESSREHWRYQLDFDLVGSPRLLVSDGTLIFNYSSTNLMALGNLTSAILVEDVILRGAPAPTAIERGSAYTDEAIDSVGERAISSGQEWVEITIGGISGWIPLDAIDPATLPPEGEIEYVYVPN